MYDLRGVLEEIICRLLNNNKKWLIFCLQLAKNSKLHLSTIAIDFILSKANEYCKLQQ